MAKTRMNGSSNGKGAPWLAPEQAIEGGSAQAFDELVGEARALAAKDVIPLRGDVALAQHNVGVAMEVLVPHEAVLRQLPAPFSWNAMARLPRLAAATVYGASRVDRSSNGKLRKDLKRAAELRAILMNGAVSPALST